jgi:acylphosphatase
LSGTVLPEGVVATMPERNLARAHVFVSGRVQGVNFRWYTQQKAQDLGVTGWVRNLWDGRVEAIFEGEEKAVQRAVEWCHVGPPSAWVERVETNYEEPTGEFSRFRITR